MSYREDLIKELRTKLATEQQLAIEDMAHQMDHVTRSAILKRLIRSILQGKSKLTLIDQLDKLNYTTDPVVRTLIREVVSLDKFRLWEL